MQYFNSVVSRFGGNLRNLEVYSFLDFIGVILFNKARILFRPILIEFLVLFALPGDRMDLLIVCV